MVNGVGPLLSEQLRNGFAVDDVEAGEGDAAPFFRIGKGDIRGQHAIGAVLFRKERRQFGTDLTGGPRHEDTFHFSGHGHLNARSEKIKDTLYPGRRGEVKFPSIRMFRYNDNRDQFGGGHAEVENVKTAASRTALVTGAARGIGRAIALRLAGETEVSAVAVHFLSRLRDAEDTAAAIRKLGKAAEVFKADFTLPTAAASLIADVEARLGLVDILVNNVGPFFLKPWENLEDDDWDRAFRGNLLSAFRAAKAVLPGMRARRWGRVINLGFSRIGNNIAFPNIAPYAAAKSSLLILTRTAAVAEADRGITVNMVSPGLIEGGVLPAGAKLKAMDVGKPADVAEAVAFLASDRAAAVTGTNLIVSGTWKM